MTTKEESNRLLLWLVAIGFFMETLDSTIVNTALPAMAKSLGENPLRMHSVVIAYSLTIAVLIPASGWIADRFGTRRAFMSAIILFSLGSILCASSHSLPQLVISRVIQGIGGAMLMPIGRLAVLRAYPHHKFLAAISFVTLPAWFGPLLGPTLGGILVEIASWHWIFLINIPVGILGIIGTYIAMPDSRLKHVSRFDLSGYLILGFSMVAISIALDGLSNLGLPPVAGIALFFLGMASFTAYWLNAGKKAAPLFSPSLFKIQTYRIGLLGNLFSRMGGSSMPFLVPLFFQVSLQFTPLQSGMMMIPTALAGMITKKFGIKLIGKYGYRQVLVTNTILLGIMMISFSLISADQPLPLRIFQLLFFGTVNSMQFTAMNTLTLKDLEETGASSGNSLFSMVQMMGMSLAVAIAGALLSMLTDQFGGKENQMMALRAFQATFLCMGMITCSSAWIFWQLPPEISDKKIRLGSGV